nr:hypothetical protein [Bacteroidales bacterium]
MKKLVFLFFILPIFAFSQEKSNVVYDENAGEDILLGNFTKQDIKQKPFIDWYNIEYNNYTVDVNELENLDLDELQNSVINIIMGSWCGDSKREVPRFYKILEYLKFDNNNIKAIAV